jgi:uncharacterized protein (DUF1778 family)
MAKPLRLTEKTLLRLPPGTLRLIRAAADAEGQNVADWIRETIFRRLKRTGGRAWKGEADK